MKQNYGSDWCSLLVRLSTELYMIPLKWNENELYTSINAMLCKSKVNTVLNK